MDEEYEDILNDFINKSGSNYLYDNLLNPAP